jgi:hypothetical protein
MIGGPSPSCDGRKATAVLQADNEAGQLGDVIVTGQAGLDMDRGEPCDMAVSDRDIGLTSATLTEVEETREDSGRGCGIAQLIEEGSDRLGIGSDGRTYHRRWTVGETDQAVGPGVDDWHKLQGPRSVGKADHVAVLRTHPDGQQLVRILPRARHRCGPPAMAPGPEGSARR